MTDLSLKTQETCVEWVYNIVRYMLDGLDTEELTDDRITGVTEDTMRDWDMYCVTDYPELPELTEDQWEGCMISVIDRITYDLVED